jgi:hypothetical protein
LDHKLLQQAKIEIIHLCGQLQQHGLEVSNSLLDLGPAINEISDADVEEKLEAIADQDINILLSRELFKAQVCFP